jgi:enoyl-CoA hydratase/carnithine racemase
VVTEAVAPTVAVSSGDGVGHLRLDRPDRRNAISLAMRAELSAALAGFDADEEIRMVVLTGSGTAFCAGVDLTEGAAAAPATGALASEPVAAPLERFRKPVLAAINGPAVGGGLELALACDLRIASTTATFALPEVRIGSLPGSGGTQRLARVVSPALAARMLLTGDPIDARAALEAGLVSDVVEPDRLEETAAALAARIAANAPLSLRAAKLALRLALEPGAGSLATERALWGLLSTTDDRAEGRAAFRERRPPEFKGR